MPSITTITNKILQEYPHTTHIKLYVCDAVYNTKINSWIVFISRVLRYDNNDHNTRTELDLVDVYKMFNEKLEIAVGNNTKTRQIEEKGCYTILINTKQKTFTSRDGKTISYYPAEYKRITSPSLIKELETKYYHELYDKLFAQNPYYRRYKNKFTSDLPDFDSD